MKRLVARFLLLSLAIALSARAGLADPGFYAPSDARIPATISNVEGVYRIFPLSYAPVAEFRLARKEEVLRAAAKTPFTQVLADEFENCRQKNIDPCPMYVTHAGVAFLADDGNLWTVGHNLSHYFRELLKSKHGSGLKKDGIKKFLQDRWNIRPKFVLYDRRGEFVYDSRRDANAGRLELMPPFRLDEKTGVEFADVAAINLSPNSIPAPKVLLRFAAADPRVGQAVFIPAYPDATRGRAKLGAPDSDGKSFRFSLGTVQEPKAALARIGEDSAEIRRKMEKLQFFINVDAHVGFSGAPVLNSDGEVVGILNATAISTKDVLKEYVPQEVLAVKPSAIAELRTYLDGLDLGVGK